MRKIPFILFLILALAAVAGVHLGGYSGPSPGFHCPPTSFTNSLPEACLSSNYVGFTGNVGNYPPYTYSICNGSLPTGLSIVSSNGQILGTVDSGATTGLTSFIICATDWVGCIYTDSVFIQVNDCAGIVVTQVVDCSLIVYDTSISGPFQGTVTYVLSNSVPLRCTATNVTGTTTFEGNAALGYTAIGGTIFGDVTNIFGTIDLTCNGNGSWNVFVTPDVEGGHEGSTNIFMGASNTGYPITITPTVVHFTCGTAIITIP